MTVPTASDPRGLKPARQASSYAWRLLLLVPAALLLGYGLYRHRDVPAGGSVTAIKLTTKPDLAGQVRDAYDSVDPATADLYLIVRSGAATPSPAVRTEPFKDTPIGSGLTWALPASVDLSTIGLVEVWDHNALLSDKQLDRIDFPGTSWSAKGQTFLVEAIGTRPTPPAWALPMAIVGGAIAGLVVLRFAWDQAL